MLRSGASEALLGHKAMAPSTLGTFLRAFTFGHVRQLDRVLGEAIKRVWEMGAGPGAKRLVIDIDSFLGEAKGRLKQGASFGYTGKRGYHPLLATRAGTGEVLHARLRKGSADDSQLQLAEEFTLEAWVKPQGAGSEEPILAKEDSSWFGYALFFGRSEANRLAGYLGEEGKVTRGTQNPATSPKNAWSHVALTFDGARMRLYVDGQQVDDTTANGPMATNGQLSIGCSKGGEEFFDGKIDEVRIYNRALSEGELDSDMHTGIEKPAQSPIAAYSFDEGEGGTAEDLTGNGHDGMIEGASWTTHGKFGGALEFDGENDCVTVPESSELDFSEEFTLESWVKPEGELHHDPIVFKEGEGFPSYALGVGIPHSGKAEGVIGQEGEGHENVYSSESLEAKVWSHLALTYDGAKLRLYVNGELVATEAVENADSGSPGPLTIGCNALFGNYFKGRIDEVRVYNRALSPPEVLASLGPLPYVKTMEAYGAEAGEAVLAGKINPQGAETTYKFEYGLTSSYGESAPESPEVSEEVIGGGHPRRSRRSHRRPRTRNDLPLSHRRHQ